MTALAPLRGTVVIDEIERRPDLFPVLRVLADRKPLRARFLILGSASPDLLRQSSESLAGCLETIALTGFSLSEVGTNALDRHWRRGNFPLSFLARSDADSFRWRQQFIQTYLERDLPQLGINVSAVTPPSRKNGHGYLPVDRDKLPVEIQQNIDMESFRIQQTFAGKIKLERGQREVNR